MSLTSTQDESMDRRSGNDPVIDARAASLLEIQGSDKLSGNQPQVDCMVKCLSNCSTAVFLIPKATSIGDLIDDVAYNTLSAAFHSHSDSPEIPPPL